MSKHRTAQGKPIDMQALAAQNKDKVALGNLGVNAGGDKLGSGGKIVQTSSERVQDYYASNPKTTRTTVSVKGTDDSEVELDATEEKPSKKTSKSKTTSKAKATNEDNKANVSGTKKAVEKELPDGSIEIVDPETDEGNNL